jgi:hypothetical protein
MKGQHTKRALVFPGNANEAFALDERSRFVPGLGDDKVMGGAPAEAPALATADALLTSGVYGLPPTVSLPLT